MIYGNDDDEVDDEGEVDRNETEELGGKVTEELGRKRTEKLGRKVTEELGGKVTEKLGRKVTEELGRKVTEKLGRKVTEELGRKGTEKLGRKVTEELGRKGTEKLGRKVTEELGRKVTEKLGRKVTEELGRKGTEKLGRKVTEELGRKGTEKLGRKVTEELGRKVTEKLGRKVTEELGRKGTEELGRKGTEKLGKKVTEELGRKVTEKLGRKVTEELGRKVTEESVTEELGRKETEETCRKVTGETGRKETEESETEASETEESGRQVIEESETEESGRKETEETGRKVIEETEESETEESGRKETEETGRKVIEETEESETEETGRKVIEETEESETDESGRKETGRKVIEETEESETEELGRKETEETGRKVIEETEESEIEESGRKETEETGSKVTEESETEESGRKETEETGRKVTEETEETEESGRKETEETGRKVIEETEESGRKETEETGRKVTEEQGRKETEESDRKEEELGRKVDMVKIKRCVEKKKNVDQQLLPLKRIRTLDKDESAEEFDRKRTDMVKKKKCVEKKKNVGKQFMPLKRMRTLDKKDESAAKRPKLYSAKAVEETDESFDEYDDTDEDSDYYPTDKKDAGSSSDWISEDDDAVGTDQDVESGSNEVASETVKGMVRDENTTDEETDVKISPVLRHKKLKRKRMLSDKNNPNIFVRKFKKSGKTNSPWDQMHACVFCGRIRSNIAKHLKTHKKRSRVKQILEKGKELGKKHETVRAMWAMLRHEGDHLNNVRVLKCGEGEMFIGRRNNDPFDINYYGPCPHCHIWIKVDKTMVRHQKVCPAVILGLVKNVSSGIKELRVSAMSISGRISEHASDKLVSEVYNIMTNDMITEVAQGDPLIISLGNLWLMKNAGNKLKRKYYTSSRMKGAARLLLNLRKLTGTSEPMSYFLNPQHFDTIIRETIMTASPDMDDEEDLNAPSTALKLGYDIKRLAGAKWGIALRNVDKEVAEDCKNFLKLMKMEWGTRVSKMAHITLQVRRFNSERSLPLPDDLFKLNDHVKNQLKDLDLTDHGFSTFRRAEVLAQTRLLLFNKRRSGEVEVIR